MKFLILLLIIPINTWAAFTPFVGATPPVNSLTTKADLITHNGTADAVLAGGTDGYVLVRDDVQATGLNWIPLPSASFTTVTKSANSTLVTTGEENVVCDTSSGNVTLTLPTAVGNNGLTYKITKDDTLNVCTIDGDGTETVGGSLTLDFYDKDDSIIIYSDNVNFQIASSHRLVTKSCKVDNSGTPVTGNNLCDSWVSSITDNAVGDSTVNITSGVFTTTPICVGVVNEIGTNISRVLNINDVSTSSLRVLVYSTSAVAVDENFSIICTGEQ